MNDGLISGKTGCSERGLRDFVGTDMLTWCDYAVGRAGQHPSLHHRVMISALQDLEDGSVRRLMLLMPPGSAKSTYSSVLFPAWWLARHPADSIVAASHTARLAESFGRNVRRLLNENAEQLGFSLSPNARAAGEFLTGLGGGYFGVGVHGAVTGRRADLAVIDDPIASFAQAESANMRDRLWNWFRSELVTRLKPGGRMMLVMTRWHDDDLAGRLIEQGGWTVLRFPALAEPCDLLGRTVGAALWPAWEDRDALLRKRTTLGERAFAAMFQQSPRGVEGTLFDVRKLNVLETIPAGVSVRAWDLAATAGASGDPDWTVGLRLLHGKDGSFVVEDVIRMRGGPHDVVKQIRHAAECDGEDVTIGLPRDPGQAGKSQVLFLAQRLAGFRIVTSPEKGSKFWRASAAAAQVAAGNMGMRRAAWNGAFLDELGAFPNGAKDDQVDALSRALDTLTSQQTPARFISLPFTAR